MRKLIYKGKLYGGLVLGGPLDGGELHTSAQNYTTEDGYVYQHVNVQIPESISTSVWSFWVPVGLDEESEKRWIIQQLVNGYGQPK